MILDQTTQNRLLSQAVEFHKGGFSSEAKKYYARLLESNPNHLDALNLSGLLAFQSGDMAEAIRLLRHAVLLDPDFADAHYHLGVVLREIDQAEQALIHFKIALRLNPQDIETIQKLSETNTSLRQLDDAVKTLQDGVTHHPDNPALLIELAKAYRVVGRFDEAAEALNRAILTGDMIGQAEFELGNLLSFVGRFDEASAAYERAIAADPANSVAYTQLSSSLFRWGKPDDAVDALRKATEILPEDPIISKHYGISLIQSGKNELAAEVLETASEIDPTDLQIKAIRGAALQWSDRPAEARAVWRDVLERDARQPDALRHLANASQGDARPTEETIRYYEAALRPFPKYANLLEVVAEGFLILNEPAKALEVCDRWLARAPGHTAAIAYKIIGLAMLNRHEDIRLLADDNRFIRPTRFVDVPGYPDVHSFNVDLAKHVLTHPTLDFMPSDKATRFGQHSGQLRFRQPRKPIDTLEAMIGDAVTAYKDQVGVVPHHPFLGHFPDEWGMTIWAIAMGSQGHQAPHIHPGGWLSGVYYPQVSDVAAREGEDNAGWIEFGRPPDEYALDTPPEVTLHRPEEGLMFLFPSYIYHRTIPYEGAEARVSVAFDIYRKRPVKKTNETNLTSIVGLE